MQTAAIPANEGDRLEALRRYDILDTPSEEEFDDFTVMASHICGTPIALISLVGGDRQWFKSRVGLEATETSRDVSFCAHLIHTQALLEVPDTQGDDRFHDNPLATGDPHIRFYAGAPLITPDGFVLGSVCVIDRVPRELSPEQRTALSALGRQVMRQIEHKRVARTLEQQRREQAAIVACIADGILELDLDGVIILQNPAAERMLAAAPGELLGREVHETHHHHRADGTVYQVDECPIHATLRDGVTRAARDDVFWRADGSSFPVEYASSALVDDRGVRRGAIVAFRDISDRKELERMKGEFVSTVSHELRTPLTSIRGALGLALGGALGEIPPKARAMLESASRNSERLTLLINDILDLDKLESGALEFDVQRLDLGRVIRQSVDANEGYAARYDVRLVFFRPEESLTVLGDDHRLAQVMANLISNAVKYSPPGERVEISVEREGSGAKVVVRDHGPGVPEEFRDRIFSRFAQADGSDTRKRGGTGLGLNIARAIIERLDGRVGFANHADGGAMFYFTIPLDGHPRPAE